MKKLFFISVFLVILPAVLFNGCNKSGYRLLYSYGIVGYEEEPYSEESEEEVLEIIEAYLAEAGCFTGTRPFDSEVILDNDRKAVEYFDANVDKIREEELEILLANRNVRFEYALKDGVVLESPDNGYMKSKTFRFGSYAGE